MLKIAHIADVHFRGLSRHDEYRKAFEMFFEQCREREVDHILIAGDIVHSKTHGISPELIDILTWWFKSMAEIAPTHVTLGNHDGLITNKDRQDAISPIIDAIDHKNLHLYKKSGNYPLGYADEGNICWNVFSCFDEENWDKVKPVEGYINIAVYHGAVRGSLIDSDWEIEGEAEVEMFEGFDFGMLGDIHKRQFLNQAKTIAYPGSTIQQNYGETPEKGWLFWEIESAKQFNCTFVPIKNMKPFVTLDWDEIDKTGKTLQLEENSRIRIKHPTNVSRAEMKQFKSVLKESYSASEIVTRIINDESPTEIKIKDENCINLRDPNQMLDLFKNFNDDRDIDDETWTTIEQKLRRYYEALPKADSARGTKWTLDKLSFDNTYGYGTNNVIDFRNINGIVGLFGKNRVGKSSIPGTISYALFNTTDRGALKNLHVINTRKNYCKAEVELSINSKRYKVERQSTKKTSRKGVVSAVTHLNVHEIDDHGNIIQDVSGEQRRDTDNLLTSMIGDKSDFFLTSFATQGEINAFIKEKSTSRKAILSNFLDLSVFDSLHELINKDAAVIKSRLSKIPERNWDIKIDELKSGIATSTDSIKQIDSRISALQTRLSSLKIELVEINPTGIVTKSDVDRCKLKLKRTQNRIQDVDTDISDNKSKIEEIEAKIEKADRFENSFPLEELEEKLKEQAEIERNLVSLKHKLQTETSKLNRQLKSAETLKTVPCGTSFPSCRFIKDSHNASTMIESQKELIDDLNGSLSTLEQSLQSMLEKDYAGKINSYRSIMKKVSNLRVQKSKYDMKLIELENEKTELLESELALSDKVSVMQSQVTDSDNETINDLKVKISNVETEISKLDSKKMSCSEAIGRDKTELKHTLAEKKNYEEMISDWKVYDILLRSTSKRGVPLQVLNSRLPKINSEIAKILGDCTNFTIELEAPLDSNEMNIYIDYGDSRRPIECASGMEKMMSSLAIRVALINISTLPKSDILLIDEGFGALDANNVESCSQLLENLKKYFKTIIIISHVESIKDNVDGLIEIVKRGPDSYVNAI